MKQLAQPRVTPSAAATTAESEASVVTPKVEVKDTTRDSPIIYELTAEDVPSIIEKEKNLVIMVFAPWCGYCKKMEPDFAKAASVLQHHCTWARLNGDQFPEAASSLGVTSFPTTLHFKDGKLAQQPIMGAMDAEKIILQVR